jgi:hypothetical protein
METYGAGNERESNAGRPELWNEDCQPEIIRV